MKSMKRDAKQGAGVVSGLSHKEGNALSWQEREVRSQPER